MVKRLVLDEACKSLKDENTCKEVPSCMFDTTCKAAVVTSEEKAKFIDEFCNIFTAETCPKDINNVHVSDDLYNRENPVCKVHENTCVNINNVYPPTSAPAV